MVSMLRWFPRLLCCPFHDYAVWTQRHHHPVPLGIYDSNVYGLKGNRHCADLTFFPVCYLMLKGLLKNIDPSLEEATRDMGATRWKVFTSVTFPLLLPGLGNAFLVTFIESVADFANPMLIGGSYDTLATTIYLQVTGAYDSTGAAAMAVVLLSPDRGAVPDPEVLSGEEDSGNPYGKAPA